ncbi:glycerophosphodiester phosphodiesterase family protein [Dactylosporangium cerinum]|uniref:Glycerophosphodiester phosphodiesterase family protein n=1 Tax=Dactylosporangium cerinum TaxID=1434730 RepID=A0ABV9VND8_9ACTN
MSMSRWSVAALTAAVAAGLLTTPAAAQANRKPASFDIQAHRGGLGLRNESTLSSFGNALRLGVTTLELDIQITEDGQAVVTHDRRVSGAKCADTAPVTAGDPEFPYVGKYIKDLTVKQVRTLDCGSKGLPDFPGQLLTPGSRVPLLREVFDLVARYGNEDVKFNLETKVEAGAPQETAPREQFVQVAAKEIRDAGLLRRVTIQSFDWGALKRMREVEPRLGLVALTNRDFLQTGQPGASPWLGGLDIDDFGGDPIAAVKTLGVVAFSPVHGFPQNGKVTDAGYQPYVTKAMVQHAHANGIKVVPWTVDDPATMNKLIDDGVDGLITDYPDRLRAVAAQRGFGLPRGTASPFDVQAHRGGKATRPENTLAAFRNSLGNADISTLELDTGVTKDGVLVVSHDRAINGAHCRDTAPVRPGDPLFPYVGRNIKDLTLAQVKTVDCGNASAPGERIPTLDELFKLVKSSGRTDIRMNIETKISPTVADTEPYWVFTIRLVTAVEKAGLAKRVTIQSFDWRTIQLSRAIDPRIETVALVWQYGPKECAALADECSLQAVYGDPKVKSPWTGTLDWWKFRDLGKLVKAVGASTVSANWQVHDPAQGTVVSDDWYLRQDPSYFHGPTVDVLHRRDGLKVVPYTVDDEATMDRVIALGVDGIISDDPEKLIAVARRAGLR